MAKAQMNIGLGLPDTAVGLLNNLSQQVTLQVGHLAAGSRTGTPADIPPGITILPNTVNLVLGKDVEKGHCITQLYILQDGSENQQLFAKIVALDMLADIDAVVEEGLHEMTDIIVASLEVIIELDSLLVLTQIEEFLVLQIEIGNITVGGIMMDVQLRIQANQLHQGILH